MPAFRSVIPPRQIAAAVLAHPHLSDAAASLGRSLKWMQKQLDKPEVQQALEEMRREVERRAVDIIVASLEEAARTMRELLQHDNARIRYDTARFILERFAGQQARRDEVVAVDE